ncbi:hypothetical protein [Kitasatospora aureofaciens]
MVERSFSRLIRARRLARDYETRIDRAEAMAWWAATPATRRLARPGLGLNSPGRSSLNHPCSTSRLERTRAACSRAPLVGQPR